MKKEINSKTKRKWIMGGLAAFASIAMLTTGFAVWVVGVQKTDQDNSVNVKVDTAQNKSISLSMELSKSDNSIVLAEAAAVTEGFVKAEGAEVVANPLQITFSSIKIEIGNGYSPRPTRISFSIDPNTAVTVSESKIVTDKRATADTWTYIDAPEDIVLPNSKDDASTNGWTWNEETTGNIVMSYTGKTCDFKWGSFFGGNNTSPCAFYNSIFTTDDNKTFDNSLKIQAELDAMHKALNTDTPINLKAKLK